MPQKSGEAGVSNPPASIKLGESSAGEDKERRIEHIVGLYERETNVAQPMGRRVTMVSSSGQPFTCVLPAGDEDEAEAVEETEADLKAVAMRKIESGFQNQCLTKNAGYWNYEVCFFDKITQFHGEKEARSQVAFSLGSYNYHFDEHPQIDVEVADMQPDGWGTVAADLPIDAPQVTYAQRYLGGTSGRRTVVQFVCHKRTSWDGSAGEIVEVKEPREFHYAITVASPHACTANYASQAKIPVPKLLKPLKQHCIYMNQGWWNYELCYGEHVRQFHMETINTAGVKDKATGTKKTQSQTVTTVEFFLGKKTTNSTIRIHKGETPSASYASQEYSGGTTCDLTGKLRKVEVRYICDADIGKSRILSIQETSTCEYVMLVSTPLICVSETFQPIQPKLVEISCFPDARDSSADAGEKHTSTVAS
ncbi:hypothetical protein AAMO2058_000991100 [Amorphochlora amoebiformis]